MVNQTEKRVQIFDNPAYSASEVARILNVPAATVKAWCLGQAYHSASGTPKRFKPVIRPADTRARLLSFANLCELHVLSAIRRQHKISLSKVRDSVDYVRSQLGADRPLIDRQFRTNVRCRWTKFAIHPGIRVFTSGATTKPGSAT